MNLKVVLAGRLKGMGHEAACEVMAKRTLSRDESKVIYSEPVIIQAPVDLPEGAFTLHFENVSMEVIHKGVLWLTGTEAHEDLETGRAGAGPLRPAKKNPVTLARRLIRDRRTKK